MKQEVLDKLLLMDSTTVFRTLQAAKESKKIGLIEFGEYLSAWQKTTLERTGRKKIEPKPLTVM